MSEDRDLGSGNGALGLRDHLLFLIASWASLLTAIVCATIPAGLPASRSVGSAFDPSTTIVVLRSKSPVEAKTSLIRAGDDNDPMSDTGAPAAVAGNKAAVATTTGSADPALLPIGVTRAPAERRIDAVLLARPPPLS